MTNEMLNAGMAVSFESTASGLSRFVCAFASFNVGVSTGYGVPRPRAREGERREVAWGASSS